ncbi:MAG: hypothetical protein WEA24_06530 [Gemmatimonadota bacterium]
MPAPSAPRPSANDRFKARGRRVWWLAAGAALALHAAVFAFTPPVEIVDALGAPVQPRMVITVGEWRAPSCGGDCPPEYATYDTLQPPPRVANFGNVQHRLPRIYPGLMWHFREPSGARLRVAIDRRGRVEEVLLLESSANGADEALVELLRRMRFQRLDAAEGSRGLVADLELGVGQPPVSG